MQIIRRPREDVVVPRDILKAGLSLGALGLWVRTESAPHIPLLADCMADTFNVSMPAMEKLIAELVLAGIWERKP